jgi:ATP-binding cassette subfamily F protein uup
MLDLEESLLEFPGALVLVTHDRHLLDRVSTTILALDGRGGVERFADFGQWEAKARARVLSTKDAGRPENAKALKGSGRKLSYLEQREWEGMEERVLAAEARLAEAGTRSEDPSIASDARSESCSRWRFICGRNMKK